MPEDFTAPVSITIRRIKAADEIRRLLPLILGGKPIDMNLEAQRLCVSEAHLRNILNGVRLPSQQLIDERGWRAAFDAHHADTWCHHRDDFERQIPALSARSNGLKARPPDKKEGIGYLFWCILGGDDICLPDAAARLKASTSTLYHIIHGTYVLTQAYAKKLLPSLAANYKEAWLIYENDFMAALANQPLTSRRGRAKAEDQRMPSAKRRAEAIRQNWRNAAAQLVNHLIETAGDDIDVLLPDVCKPSLRVAQNWRRLAQGDLTLAASIYTDALNEICRLYNLKERSPACFLEAQRLTKHARREAQSAKVA